MRTNALFVALAVIISGVLSGCGEQPLVQPKTTNPTGTTTIPASAIEQKFGTAIMLVIDTSGSMSDSPKEGGTAKIVSARAAAKEVVSKAEAFATAHPDRTVLLGIVKFSSSASTIREISKPSLADASAAIDALTPEDGTHIGDAIYEAKRQLDMSGYADKHIVVVTDGENGGGRDPDAVSKAIYEQADGTKMYVVGFDVNGSTYDGMKAYATILSAKDSVALDAQLKFVLDKKILAEQD